MDGWPQYKSHVFCRQWQSTPVAFMQGLISAGCPLVSDRLNICPTGTSHPVDLWLWLKSRIPIRCTSDLKLARNEALLVFQSFVVLLPPRERPQLVKMALGSYHLTRFTAVKQRVHIVVRLPMSHNKGESGKQLSCCYSATNYNGGHICNLSGQKRMALLRGLQLTCRSVVGFPTKL